MYLSVIIEILGTFFLDVDFIHMFFTFILFINAVLDLHDAQLLLASYFHRLKHHYLYLLHGTVSYFFATRIIFECIC